MFSYIVLLLLLLDGTNRSFVASKKTESPKTFTSTHRQGFLCLLSSNLKSFSIIYPMCNCLSETMKEKVVKQLMKMSKHWKRRTKQCNNILFLTIKEGQNGFMMDEHHVNNYTLLTSVTMAINHAFVYSHLSDVTFSQWNVARERIIHATEMSCMNYKHTQVYRNIAYIN
jgi:hypothetical protein